MKRKNCPYHVIRSKKYEIGRITVYQDYFQIGKKEYPYTYVVNKDSVCILAVYDGAVAAIEQYRYTLDEWMLELPAGTVDEGEESEAAAARELREETGLIAERMVYLGNYYMNQGISSARCDMYFAYCREQKCQKLEAAELIRTKLIPIKQFDQMVSDNEFKLLVGLAGWQQAKKRGLI